MAKEYQASSVKKALDILRLISETEQGSGVTALAKSLGISKSTVYGIRLTAPLSCHLGGGLLVLPE